MIITGSRSVCCPPGSIPIACFTSDVIPIAASFLSIDDDQKGTVRLPVIAAVAAGAGRLAVFGNIEMLYPTVAETCDNATVVLNICQWLSGAQSSISRVAFAGFGVAHQTNIAATLEAHGVRAVFCDFEFASEEPMIVVGSDVDLELRRDFLTDFLRKGRGIGVFCIDHKSALALNSFLVPLGLGLPRCVLSDERAASNAEDLCPQYDAMTIYLFPNMVASFRRLASGPPSSDFLLDDLVTAIRSYVQIPEYTELRYVDQLIEYAWEYLRATCYKTTEKLICPKVTHAIVTVLLQDLYEKLPIERTMAHPDSALFPGISGEPAGTFSHSLELRSERWISTGMWLNAGVFGEIECQAPPDGLLVQVGAHSRSLIMMEGPWHRWPTCQTWLPICRRSTTVVSQFGGIVYLIVPDIKSQTIDVTFRNFCTYPIFDLTHSPIPFENQGCESPWCEILCRSMIFTLPTAEFRRLNHVSAAVASVEQFVKTLSKLLSYSSDRPIRIIFDVDASPELVAEYPINLVMSDINDILTNPNRPTDGLARMLTVLAMSFFRDGCFDSMLERALGAMAMSLTFADVYCDFDPADDLTIELPPLFNELWYIHSEMNATVFPELLRLTQTPEAPVFDAAEDQWLYFVKLLSDLVKMNFVPLFKRIRLVPLSLAAELEHYPAVPLPE
jgi:hypothetical protein